MLTTVFMVGPRPDVRRLDSLTANLILLLSRSNKNCRRRSAVRGRSLWDFERAAGADARTRSNAARIFGARSVRLRGGSAASVRHRTFRNALACATAAAWDKPRSVPLGARNLLRSGAGRASSRKK